MFWAFTPCIWTFISFLDFFFLFQTFISFLAFDFFFWLLFPFSHKSRSDLGFFPSLFNAIFKFNAAAYHSLFNASMHQHSWNDSSENKDEIISLNLWKENARNVFTFPVFTRFLKAIFSLETYFWNFKIFMDLLRSTSSKWWKDLLSKSNSEV